MIKKYFLCACLTISTFAFTVRPSYLQFDSVSRRKSYNEPFDQEITRLIGAELAKDLMRVKYEVGYVDDETDLKSCPEHHNTVSEAEQSVIERYERLMKTNKHYCKFVVYDYKPFYKFGEQDYDDFNLDIRTALSCGAYASGVCIMCPQTCSQFCYDLCSVAGSYPSDNDVLEMIKRNMYIRGNLRYKTKEERELKLDAGKFCDFGLSEDVKGYICFALRYTYHCGFWGCDFLQTFIWLFAVLGDSYYNRTEMSIINGTCKEGYDLVFTRVPWIVSNASMTSAQRFLVAMFGSIASSYASKYQEEYPLARVGERTSYLYSIWLSYSKLPQWSVIALLGHEFDSFSRKKTIESQLELEDGFMVLRNSHTGDFIKENKPGEFFYSQTQLFDTIKCEKSKTGYCEDDIVMHELLNIYITDCERELGKIWTNMTKRIKFLECLHVNEINESASEFVKEISDRFDDISKKSQKCDSEFLRSIFHNSFYDSSRITKLILDDEYAFNMILKPRLNMVLNYVEYITMIRDLKCVKYDMQFLKDVSIERFISMKHEDIVSQIRKATCCEYFETNYLSTSEKCISLAHDKEQNEVYRIKLRNN